jgi:hypothetical protein
MCEMSLKCFMFKALKCFVLKTEYSNLKRSTIVNLFCIDLSVIQPSLKALNFQENNYTEHI